LEYETITVRLKHRGHAPNHNLTYFYSYFFKGPTNTQPYKTNKEYPNHFLTCIHVTGKL
jgi:hypothetical protein